MRTTVLGFAFVISFGVALAPLLVQTERISAQPFDPVAITVVPSACADAGGGSRGSGSEAKSHSVVIDCPSIPSMPVADAGDPAVSGLFGGYREARRLPLFEARPWK
jgi:hypothetical protein